MGVKFQARPHDQDSQIIIHVRMLDSENALQQEALGIVGVNLLYGAFFLDARSRPAHRVAARRPDARSASRST